MGPGSYGTPALLLTLIHRSAWNRNSRKFAVASYSCTQRQPLHNKPCCTPLGLKHPDLVAVVAPICIKKLRLVTMQLPEKFSPIGAGLKANFALRSSRKFAASLGRWH